MQTEEVRLVRQNCKQKKVVSEIMKLVLSQLSNAALRSREMIMIDLSKSDEQRILSRV